MSIGTLIRWRVGEGRLFPLFPKAAGATPRRAMFLTEELWQLLNTNHDDPDMEDRLGDLQADLEFFVENGRIHPKYLFLLYPARDAVWEIRSVRPQAINSRSGPLRRQGCVHSNQLRVARKSGWLAISGMERRETSCARQMESNFSTHTVLDRVLTFAGSQQAQSMVDTSKKELKRRDIAYYRRRQQNRVFTALAEIFEEEAEKGATSKKELAAILGKDPSQITRWFAGPSNLELDTISDILLAMGAEMDHRVVRFSERTKPNYVHPLLAPYWDDQEVTIFIAASDAEEAAAGEKTRTITATASSTAYVEISGAP